MTEPVPPALPTEGGSYIRQPDGSLERQVEPEAQPEKPAEAVTPKAAKPTVKEA